jgi:LacI family transcriptional regulator
MNGPGTTAKAVGIEDVARAAEVSITTVSHALSGRGQVAAATRERVRRIADELGYAPNRLASALRSRRSQILGFVADDIATTPFATRVVLGAQEAAAERGQLLMVMNSNREPTIEAQQLTGLLSAQVDALIYARMFHEDSSDLPRQLDRVVSAIIDTSDRRGRVPSIVPDEEQIGDLATQTLIDAGHRDIVHLTITPVGRGRVGRLSGYRRAMERAGLTPVVFEGGAPGDAAAGRRAFAAFRDSGVPATAVFTFNDPMAMGVYQAAIRSGVRIPDDLSVISVDDFEPVAAALLPALTTVALPHYEMGRWAVETVLDQLDTGAASRGGEHVIPGRLVERDSIRTLS